MTGVARLTDLSTPLSQPRVAIAASPKTFADSLGVNRLGDLWTPHSPHPFPDATIIASNKTFSDNIGWSRLGDVFSCGDTVATASNKTFSV